MRRLAAPRGQEGVLHHHGLLFDVQRARSRGRARGRRRRTRRCRRPAAWPASSETPFWACQTWVSSWHEDRLDAQRQLRRREVRPAPQRPARRSGRARPRKAAAPDRMAKIRTRPGVQARAEHLGRQARARRRVRRRQGRGFMRETAWTVDAMGACGFRAHHHRLSLHEGNAHGHAHRPDGTRPEDVQPVAARPDPGADRRLRAGGLVGRGPADQDRRREPACRARCRSRRPDARSRPSSRDRPRQGSTRSWC